MKVVAKDNIFFEDGKLSFVGGKEYHAKKDEVTPDLFICIDESGSKHWLAQSYIDANFVEQPTGR